MTQAAAVRVSQRSTQESERRLGIRDATRAARSPTTGMASTIVIKTKLSGITFSLRRSRVRQTRRPNERRVNTGCNAAFYPEAEDRGKNVRHPVEVSGSGTPSSTGERQMMDKPLDTTRYYSFVYNMLSSQLVRGTAVANMRRKGSADHGATNSARTGETVRKAMYYGAERKREGLRALLSVAAIAAGLVLSNIAASSTLYPGAESGDVVGVWQWVEPGETSQAGTPLFEIRRAADGELEAMVLVRSGDRVSEADVSYDQGHLCMVTEHGASFKGELSDDGLMIEGVIQYEGSRSTALLQRVEHRKMRRAAGRKAYAT